MTEYPIGTVAMVTALNRREPYRAHFDGDTWRDLACLAFCVDVPASIRPLVVLDWHPNPADLPDLLKVLRENYWTSLADQLEAQTKPPRIPEPGRWGVVEAHTQRDDRRRTFLHHDSAIVRTDSWHDTNGAWHEWADLLNPVLIREGVDA